MTEARLTLTVNGERHELKVSARAHLADVLRDHLHVTSPHLACEQGVCGACTVRVNGKPIRSCITYSSSCDGATIDTIEGYAGDKVMDRLRRAFSENHALQCGFCTSGMLVAAHDIVERLDEPDEKRIRNELAGNLCRCTGYVGIVRAIAQVIRERQPSGAAEPAAIPPAAREARALFQPFEPEFTSRTDAPDRTAVTVVEDGEILLRRTVRIRQPSNEVWDHFSDLPRVAKCLPGAKIEELGDETFSGQLSVGFGPVSANFKGNGTYRFDPEARSAELVGRGKDKGGSSSVSGTLSYRVREDEEPGASILDVEMRFRLVGALAQFNRPEYLNGFVDYLVRAFVSNSEAMIGGESLKENQSLSAFALMRAVITARFTSWFRRER